ncbi:MAG: hypothetical protein V1707_02170 [bacterium]
MFKNFFIAFLSFLLFLPSLSSAKPFSPSLLLINEYLEDHASLDQGSIQGFLESLSSSLAVTRFSTPDGFKLASEIIADVSNQYKINPQYLLILLQKEQSLLTDPSPTQDQYDWATGFGVCDSCAKTDPRIQKYKGFYNQVERAAWRHRYYLAYPRQFYFQVGNTYEIDGIAVTIENEATAALYNYTPHIKGNNLFWQLWNKYFSSPLPTGTIVQVKEEPKTISAPSLPEGLVAEATDKSLWLIQDGKRRKINSPGVLLSHSLAKPVAVSSEELVKYSMGDDVRYSNYSYLRAPDKTVYLVNGNVKRKIASKDIQRQLGINPEEIINATDNDLALLDNGQDITTTSLYPLGALLQNKESGAVFYVKDGYKYPVPAREVLQYRFPKLKPAAVQAKELDSLTDGPAVTFGEGALVKGKNSPVVYVVSNGYLRPIETEKDFVGLGYDWKAIIEVADEVLSYYGVDVPISLGY